MTLDISKIEIAREKIHVFLARMGVQDPYLFFSTRMVEMNHDKKTQKNRNIVFSLKHRVFHEDIVFYPGTAFSSVFGSLGIYIYIYV